MIKKLPLLIIKLYRFIFYAFILGIGSIIACYFWISNSSSAYLYDNIQQVPHRQVGLILGTSKYLRKRQLNEYYEGRIKAAEKLYHAGKVDYFIVSGDNRAVNYNEPKQMTKDLVAAGIPKSHIQPDYAGIRTLDSILRTNKVFGHKDYLIISQKFHNERALFLAKHNGQQPIAFNAANPYSQNMTKIIIREVFARVKAVMDILFRAQARHYGQPIVFPTP